jgi:hypothetical protein
MRFEPTIPASERAKTSRPLWSAAFSFTSPNCHRHATRRFENYGGGDEKGLWAEMRSAQLHFHRVALGAATLKRNGRLSVIRHGKEVCEKEGSFSIRAPVQPTTLRCNAGKSPESTGDVCKANFRFHSAIPWLKYYWSVLFTSFVQYYEKQTFRGSSRHTFLDVIVEFEQYFIVMTIVSVILDAFLHALDL